MSQASMQQSQPLHEELVGRPMGFGGQADKETGALWDSYPQHPIVGVKLPPLPPGARRGMTALTTLRALKHRLCSKQKVSLHRRSGLWQLLSSARAWESPSQGRGHGIGRLGLRPCPEASGDQLVKISQLVHRTQRMRRVQTKLKKVNLPCCVVLWLSLSCVCHFCIKPFDLSSSTFLLCPTPLRLLSHGLHCRL